MSAIQERQWLPDPPPPWQWELADGQWALSHQDPHKGDVVAATVQRSAVGDPDLLADLGYVIANLPPTYIAKSHGA